MVGVVVVIVVAVVMVPDGHLTMRQIFSVLQQGMDRPGTVDMTVL